jgi:hypothetical protein
MTNQVILHKDDLEAIKKFTNKYPESDFITIKVDSSSGIGSIISASIVTTIDKDMVTITKTIVDESSW